VSCLFADPLPLPLIESSYIHFGFMPQAKKAPFALPSVVGFKVGNEEESPSLVASHLVGSTIIAKEGGLAYMKRMMARGGSARNWESEPQAFVTLLPSAHIYVLPHQPIHTQPITMPFERPADCSTSSTIGSGDESAAYWVVLLLFIS